MAQYNNGIEALKAHDFNVKISKGMKEVPGIIDGETITLFWNVGGDNSCWKKDAVAEYQRQQNLKLDQ